MTRHLHSSHPRFSPGCFARFGTEHPATGRCAFRARQTLASPHPFAVFTTLLLAALATSLQAAQPVLGVEAIERGQTGYGLSVFHGTEPERFGVEVIGVLHNNTAELSYILARLSGQDLETSGVAAGMSGSPVYIDGKLIGAVSFSWAFSQNAIAGITPIEGMRKLRQAADVPALGDRIPLAQRPLRRDPGHRLVPGLSVPSLHAIASGQLETTLLDAALARLRPASTGDGQPAVLLEASGFSDPALARLRRAAGPMAIATGGQMSGPAPSGAIRGGDAVAMLLVTGDLSLAAHGTVTEVDGDRLLAFGHSVFGLGPALVPMARSEVLATVSSLSNSFKLSNAGPLIGAFDQDREAGVRGVLGLEAPMIPLHVALRGGERRDYAMQLADLPPLLPTLVTAGVYGALNAGSYSAGDMGIDLRARLHLAGYQDLLLDQSFDSDTAGTDAVLYLLGVVSYLTGNDLEAARFTGIDVTLEQAPRPRVATLTAAHAERSRVAPGDTVALDLELQPFRGAPIRHRLALSIPQDTADGTYVVLVGDGPSIDAALDSVAPHTPRTLGEALSLLGSYRSRHQLAILGLVGGAGLAIEGQTLPALPASMRALLTSAGQQTKALSLVVRTDRTLPAPMPISGLTRIDFQVRRSRR